MLKKKKKKKIDEMRFRCIPGSHFAISDSRVPHFLFFVFIGVSQIYFC